MTRTALYRHFDASGRLLYVGITDCLSERDRRHRATASWHGEVVRTETQWCLSREHAADLERVAIRHEKPLHNIMHVACVPVVVTSADADQAANTPTLDTLFKAWPNRQALADQIGANVEAVHKWASAGRIPSAWQKRVIDAAAEKGLTFATADWMLAMHDAPRVSADVKAS